MHHFAFIDDDHGLTVSEVGDLGVWDLQAKKVLRWFKTRALSTPGRVMLQANVAQSMNKSVETERVTQLLTNAGYQVVAQGGKATFVANLREQKQGEDKPLEQMSEADFRPTKDLILLSGNKAIWRRGTCWYTCIQ